MTTLAVESAAAISRTGASVAVIDLDLYGGDTHYRLDVAVSRSGHTLADLLPVVEELDRQMIENAFSRCPCGVFLLPAPVDPREAALVEPEHVRRIVSSVSAAFDLVILDTAARLDEVTRAALGTSGLLVLVATPELSCLGGTRRVLDHLEPEVPAGERPALILNRSLGRSDLVTVREAEEFLGLPVSAVLPEASVLCRRAADEGRLVGGDRSELGRLISETAARLLAPALR